MRHASRAETPPKFSTATFSTVTANPAPTRGFLPIVATNSALRSLKASEGVARDIVDDIVVRRLREGDGLPSESAMLQHYGVSRETLREGLRLLEVQGLISIRRGPGGGPIVGTIDPASLGRTSTLYFHLAGATYAELFDAWVVCERVIADLAASNPDRAAVREAMARSFSPTATRTRRSRSSSSSTSSSTPSLPRSPATRCCSSRSW